MAQINTRSSPKDAMEQIRKALSPTQLAIFQTLCFGDLLDARDIKLSAVSP